VSKSIYVHIPFCSRRCDYCDFATWVDKSDLVGTYIDSVITQWKYHLVADELSKDEEIKSIFFGGGTPNFIDPKYICRILEQINDACSISSSAEITLESNPDHVNEAAMKKYIAGGVNRISMGVQSTQEHVLEYLGREHKRENVYRSIETIRTAGINNFNCDLIYGSPVESISDWELTLNEIIELSPTHISAYALGIEKGTPLDQDIKLGKKATTLEDDLSDKYELCDQILENASYGWYEISNWSKPDFESKHNLTYWVGGDVIALGCASHGTTNNKRWSTPRHIETYIQKIQNLESDPTGFFIDQTADNNEQHKQEKFALLMRTNIGYEWPRDFNSEKLNEYRELKMLTLDKFTNRLVLTTKGKLLAHRIIIDLYEELANAGYVVE